MAQPEDPMADALYDEFIRFRNRYNGVILPFPFTEEEGRNEMEIKDELALESWHNVYNAKRQQVWTEQEIEINYQDRQVFFQDGVLFARGHVRTVDLENKIREIGADQIQYFDCSYSSVSEVPLQLESIKGLLCRWSRVRTFHPRFKLLELLDCSYCEMVLLPQFPLLRLRHLHCMGTPLVRLNDQMPRLTLLNCSHCPYLSEIPDALMLTLQWLFCYKLNQDFRLPALLNPVPLQVLACQSKTIEEIPACYRNLVHLRMVYSTRFSRFPDLENPFPVLETLQVFGCNSLVGLPLYLPMLKTLECDSCASLLNLPTNTPMLQVLDCSGCDALTHLPEDIPATIRELNCSECPELESLSEDSFPGLTKLDCSNCPTLTDLAFSAPLLVALECRRCDRLETLPDARSLQNLSCGGCRRLKRLPHELRSPQLVEIDCEGCKKIKRIPAYPGLRSLNCMRTKISRLPDLPELQELSCRGSEVTCLPHGLYQRFHAGNLEIQDDWAGGLPECQNEMYYYGDEDEDEEDEDEEDDSEEDDSEEDDSEEDDSWEPNDEDNMVVLLDRWRQENIEERDEEVQALRRERGAQIAQQLGLNPDLARHAKVLDILSVPRVYDPILINALRGAQAQSRAYSEQQFIESPEYKTYDVLMADESTTHQEFLTEDENHLIFMVPLNAAETEFKSTGWDVTNLASDLLSSVYRECEDPEDPGHPVSRLFVIRLNLSTGNYFVPLIDLCLCLMSRHRVFLVRKMPINPVEHARRQAFEATRPAAKRQPVSDTEVWYRSASLYSEVDAVSADHCQEGTTKLLSDIFICAGNECCQAAYCLDSR